jgi:transposase
MEEISMTGCDLHDKNLVLRTSLGRGRDEGAVFENTKCGKQAMILKLKERAAAAGCKRIVFAYEASGQGYLLHDELVNAGIECYVLAPTKIKRSEKDKRDKTDKKDCKRLLELLRGHFLAGNELPVVRVPNLQQRDDRELMRCRLDVAVELQSVKNKIKALLKRNAVQKPKEIRPAKWLKEVASGRSGKLLNGAQTTLESLVRRAEALQKEIGILDGKIEELADQERHRKPVSELRKLKGVGILSAMVFLAEMGTLTRFSNRRKVAAYIGLIPTCAESGSIQDRKGHITRQGSSRLRRILCQCVWTRIRTDPEEIKVYERLKEKNPKKKKIAVVALMRRLAIRMWHRAIAATAA